MKFNEWLQLPETTKIIEPVTNQFINNALIAFKEFGKVAYEAGQRDAGKFNTRLHVPLDQVDSRTVPYPTTSNVKFKKGGK